MNIEETQKLVKKYFEGKLDKGGKPYIKHLEYVSSRGRNETEKIMGLLHDILEDTNLTANDLLNLGFSKEIVEVVEILTRKKGESYNNYIDSIIMTKNEAALYIKKIDMEHNMDLSRLKNIQIKDILRVKKKYKPNYEKICKALKRMEK